MEASQLNGDAEECSSSESGWTMYLASPMHDHGASDDHDDVEGDDGDAAAAADGSSSSDRSGGEEEGDEDDDSMASDASTGPARSKYSYRKGDGMKALERLKQNEEKNGNYSQQSSHSLKTAPKLEENDRDGNSRSPFHREAGTASSKSNPKARKIHLSSK